MAIWLVRAGKYGEQEQDCLENNFVTIGYNDLPDLSKFQNRDDLRKGYAKVYSNESEETVTARSSQVWHFSHSIKVGDIVALPLKRSPYIAFGKVTETYRFTNEYGLEIKHVLPVKWIDKEVPRKSFDQNLRYSFGAAMTVCRIERNDAEKKILAILNPSKTKTQETEAEDKDTDVEINFFDAAKEQIVDHIIQNFKEHALEELVEAIFNAQGFVTDRTGKGTDGGADILASPGPLGFEGPRFLIEVKSGQQTFGSKDIDRLRGAVEKFGAEYCIFVSLFGFKEGVKRKYRQSYFKIRLWDQDDLLNALFKNYDNLPKTIQARIPLQRTWLLAKDDV